MTRRVVLLLGAGLGFSPSTQAGGLDDLLTRAANSDPQVAGAVADADATAARAGQARAGLLPQITVRAGYTRNQYATEVTIPGQDPVVITPIDQLEANARLDVPLIDLAAWTDLAAAQGCRSAA
jgi:outer membrane protein TolC